MTTTGAQALVTSEDTPPADWRTEIDADTARLTAFLAELKGAGAS